MTSVQDIIQARTDSENLIRMNPPTTLGDGRILLKAEYDRIMQIAPALPDGDPLPPWRRQRINATFDRNLYKDGEGLVRIGKSKSLGSVKYKVLHSGNVLLIILNEAKAALASGSNLIIRSNFESHLTKTLKLDFQNVGKVLDRIGLFTLGGRRGNQCIIDGRMVDFIQHNAGSNGNNNNNNNNGSSDRNSTSSSSGTPIDEISYAVASLTKDLLAGKLSQNEFNNAMKDINNFVGDGSAVAEKLKLAVEQQKGINLDKAAVVQQQKGINIDKANVTVRSLRGDPSAVKAVFTALEVDNDSDDRNDNGIDISGGLSSLDINAGDNDRSDVDNGQQDDHRVQRNEDGRDDGMEGLNINAAGDNGSDSYSGEQHNDRDDDGEQDDDRDDDDDDDDDDGNNSGEQDDDRGDDDDDDDDDDGDNDFAVDFDPDADGNNNSNDAATAVTSPTNRRYNSLTPRSSPTALARTTSHSKPNTESTVVGLGTTTPRSNTSRVNGSTTTSQMTESSTFLGRNTTVLSTIGSTTAGITKQRDSSTCTSDGRVAPDDDRTTVDSTNVPAPNTETSTTIENGLHRHSTTPREDENTVHSFPTLGAEQASREGKTTLQQGPADGPHVLGTAKRSWEEEDRVSSSNKRMTTMNKHIWELENHRFIRQPCFSIGSAPSQRKSTKNRGRIGMGRRIRQERRALQTIDQNETKSKQQSKSKSVTWSRGRLEAESWILTDHKLQGRFDYDEPLANTKLVRNMNNEIEHPLWQGEYRKLPKVKEVLGYDMHEGLWYSRNELQGFRSDEKNLQFKTQHENEVNRLYLDALKKKNPFYKPIEHLHEATSIWNLFYGY